MRESSCHGAASTTPDHRETCEHQRPENTLLTHMADPPCLAPGPSRLPAKRMDSFQQPPNGTAGIFLFNVVYQGPVRPSLCLLGDALGQMWYLTKDTAKLRFEPHHPAPSDELPPPHEAFQFPSVLCVWRLRTSTERCFSLKPVSFICLIWFLNFSSLSRVPHPRLRASVPLTAVPLHTVFTDRFASTWLVLLAQVWGDHRELQVQEPVDEEGGVGSVLTALCGKNCANWKAGGPGRLLGRTEREPVFGCTTSTSRPRNASGNFGDEQ
ncbi:hypothetical protein CB1_000327004 [Camelus ferus]|nr:hypothetical protein CB1_000327004 [Camelus ferus]